MKMPKTLHFPRLEILDVPWAFAFDPSFKAEHLKIVTFECAINLEGCFPHFTTRHEWIVTSNVPSLTKVLLYINQRPRIGYRCRLTLDKLVDKRYLNRYVFEK
jgi:hypothetical protein